MEEKLNKAAARLLSAASPGKGKGKEKGKETLRLIEAIGMKGRVRFTSLEERAGTVAVSPAFSGERAFSLRSCCKGRGKKERHLLIPFRRFAGGAGRNLLPGK